MTAPSELWTGVQQLIGAEARYLDLKRWDEWLALYEAGAEYYVPAWTDRGELTSDPQRELALIYYPDRSGLEDRVFRLRTGRSGASTPPIRTCHLATLLHVEADGDAVAVETSWTTHSYRGGHVMTNFGRAAYRLARGSDGFVIRAKTTVLLNDMTDTLIDFYMI